MSSPAFLFKQSSPKVSEAETVKGILRLFWASQENEVGTSQESKGRSQYLMCFGDGIKGTVTARANQREPQNSLVPVEGQGRCICPAA